MATDAALMRSKPGAKPRETDPSDVADRGNHQCRGWLWRGSGHTDAGVSGVWFAHNAGPEPENGTDLHRDLDPEIVLVTEDL